MHGVNVKKPEADAGGGIAADGKASRGSAVTQSDMLRLQASHMQSIISMTPWMLLLNIVVSLLFVALAKGELPFERLMAWSGTNVAVSLLVIAHLHMVKRSCASRECTANYIRVVRLQGVVLGLVWAFMPILFFPHASADLRIIIMTLTVGVFSIGSFRLSHVPFAAISYLVLPSMALAVMSVGAMGGTHGMFLCIYVLLYAAAMSFVVIARYKDTMTNLRNLAELKRQKNIIGLLLNDFENGARDWMWETDLAGNLTYVPERLAELLGKHRDDIMGYCLHTVLGEEDNNPAWMVFYGVLKAGRTLTGITVPATIKGERRWLRMAARPLHDASGELSGYRGVASDVTDQHEREEMLRREKEEAQNEARAKSNFLAVVSHELRTPLNAMVGFAELIAKETAGPLGGEYREYSRHLLDGSRQLQRLIDDILDYTRFERNKIKLVEQEVDLVDMAEMALRQIAHDDRAAGLELELRYEDDIVVKGDIGRLQQVLNNLLVNAIKFTDEGRVTVDISTTNAGGVKVSVIDTGKGIPPDQLEKLFKPFTQVEGTMTRRHDGIGLGLSIARSLVRLHGGELKLENNPEGGVTASFTIPASRVVESSGACAA